MSKIVVHCKFYRPFFYCIIFLFSFFQALCELCWMILNRLDLLWTSLKWTKPAVTMFAKDLSNCTNYTVWDPEWNQTNPAFDESLSYCTGTWKQDSPTDAHRMPERQQCTIVDVNTGVEMSSTQSEMQTNSTGAEHKVDRVRWWMPPQFS